MREELRTQQDGLGERREHQRVFHFAAPRDVEGFLRRRELHFDFFVRVEMRFRRADAVFDQHEAAAVVEDGGIRGGASERHGSVAREAGFLRGFPRGGAEKVFAFVDDSAGEFPRKTTDAETELPDEDDFSVARHGNDGDPVRRVRDVEVAFAPVRRVLEMFFVDVEDDAGRVQVFPGQIPKCGNAHGFFFFERIRKKDAPAFSAGARRE